MRDTENLGVEEIFIKFLAENYILMFFLVLLGIMFLYAGRYLYNHPPEYVNMFYGYRTQLSMSSKRRWDYAQVRGSLEMMLAGNISLSLGMFFVFVPISEIHSIPIGLFIILGLCAMMFIRTQKAIRHKYPEK